MNCNVNIISQNYRHISNMVDTYAGLYVMDILLQGKAVMNPACSYATKRTDLLVMWKIR